MKKKTASSRPAKRPAKLASPSRIIESALGKHGAHTGNAMTPLQFSTYVRAPGETVCNGLAFSYGKLRTFDLGPLVNGSGFHRAVADIVNNRFQEQCIVYIWRTYQKSGFVTVYGATITDTKDRVLHRICARAGNRAYKMNVIRYLEAAAGIKSPPGLVTGVC